jgi:formylglycine-generating enzyme required for sulfatase activity
MELLAIPAGRFIMGSPDGEIGRSSWEGPQHEVQVAAFLLGRLPVTNEEYARYLAERPQVDKPAYWESASLNEPRLPVVGVSWHEAKEFAAWAACRLPSEAEWEYAVRAGTSHPYVLGPSELDLMRFAWYRQNSDGRIHSVGERAPNAWGLHDMLGNVWEWVEDDVHAAYAGAPVDGSPWIDSSRPCDRVVRGSAFYDDSRLVRAAVRDWRPSTSRRDDLGFRLAKSLP